MSRHDIDLDPQIAAELSALEDALNDVPGADPELCALVRDVRASAPPMPLALRVRLDRDVAAGFPTPQRTRPRLPRPRRLPALGTAFAMLLVAVVGVSALRTRGGNDDASTATRLGASDSASTAGGASAAPKASSTPAAAVPESGGGVTQQRKVERTTSLTLRVAAGALEDAADGVVRATQAVGGYVADSQVSARGARGSADFTLRVPSARLDDAIARLSRLGHVAAIDQSARDITGSVGSAADRLKDARRERDALLRALGAASSSGAIDALRTRIRANRSEIARREGELDALRRRADLATVAVTLRAAAATGAASPGDDGHWGPAAAARDALRVLEVAAGVALVALTVLLPVGLLAGLGLLGGRGARRRRRESALDGA